MLHPCKFHCPAALVLSWEFYTAACKSPELINHITSLHQPTTNDEIKYLICKVLPVYVFNISQHVYVHIVYLQCINNHYKIHFSYVKNAIKLDLNLKEFLMHCYTWWGQDCSDTYLSTKRPMYVLHFGYINIYHRILG